jgi:ABC-2 type transport system ATP-binding protein
MNILCGALNQTEGSVTISGIDLRKHPMEAKQQLGFLPQMPPLHFDLTVDEYLNHCAHMRLMEKKRIPKAIADVKEQCGIGHFSQRLIRNLSGGYRQRVGIAQAIVHTPKLVVMDEPTNGLDPNQIAEIRSLIKDIAKDRAVIFSSHILSEVQATCRDVRMIENGRLVFSDTMESFNNYIIPGSLLLTLEAPPSIAVLNAIPGISNVESLTERTFRLYFNESSGITEKIVNISVAEGWRLSEIAIEKSSLDAIFAKLSNKAPNHSR